MPRLVHIHSCADGSEVESDAAEVCPRCGATPVRHWVPSSIIERVWLLQEKYKLRYSPIEGVPHADLADELLDPCFMECPECDGNGLYDDGVATVFHELPECERCHGLGEVLAVSEEEFARRREEVLKAYPEANKGPGRALKLEYPDRPKRGIRR